MNFQDFCNQQANAADQAVEINNTFVISFGKPEGTTFNIDPDVIALFLKYLVDNEGACRSAIETHPKFTAQTFTKYQEKPYRALYSLVDSEPKLNAIKSLGGSQTNQLTQIISKLICFLSGTPYSGIVENTHFDKQSVVAALANMPSDLRTLAEDKSQAPNIINPSAMKKRFETWLRETKKLSEKSIKNYAGSAVSKVDAIIYDPGDNRSIYDIHSPDTIAEIIKQLAQSPEWQQKNSAGKQMWNTAVNHYHIFLIELELETEQVSLPLNIQSKTIPKPFLLLAGISGTGKTRFVREQARTFDPALNNFCLVPVRPDWHEPSELLGYVTRLTGAAQYVPTELVLFLVKAWEKIAPNASAAGCGDLETKAAPYWLCLDEMNLAPVEQYFADYLSVLESRNFEDGLYSCDALLSKELIGQLVSEDKELRNHLGVHSDGLWEYFINNGIQIPPNLIVAGTVNMDETTHGFSRKVIDRAITLDFGEFYPNDYSEFFKPSTTPTTYSWSIVTQASLQNLAGTCDPDGAKSIEFLEKVNAIVRQSSFELAFRALNELLLQVICMNPSNDNELRAVWDDFLMMKILPRIEGDEDKLRCHVDESTGNILEELSNLLAEELAPLWTKDRKDFFRVAINPNKELKIECRSKRKIEWMSKKLEVNTFTSYWP